MAASAAVCIVAAGCHARQPAPVPSNPQPAATRPSTAPTITAATETFRLAGPGDLQALLIAAPGGNGHFPLCTVKIYNVASEDVILGYEPGSVIVHCGEFERRAPDATFITRREILRPNQPLEFELPPGGAWARSPSAGSRELLVPIELPSGTYTVWATFRAAGPATATITSRRDVYRVH